MKCKFVCRQHIDDRKLTWPHALADASHPLERDFRIHPNTTPHGKEPNSSTIPMTTPPVININFKTLCLHSVFSTQQFLTQQYLSFSHRYEIFSIQQYLGQSTHTSLGIKSIISMIKCPKCIDVQQWNLGNKGCIHQREVNNDGRSRSSNNNVLRGISLEWSSLMHHNPSNFFQILYPLYSIHKK